MAAQPTEAQLQQMANKLRAHSLRMTTHAGSGHPSTCLSMAEIMAVLFFDQMRFDPKDPTAKDVDQLVLSKGHAAPILWAALSEAGAIKDDLMTLREIDSDIEGHPTPRSPWVRVATGSLGQGLSAACGMALVKQKEKLPGLIYCVLGDGEIAEGSVWEAAQFASHYKLDQLCAVVDLNHLGQSGPSYFQDNTKSLAAHWEGFGWDAVVVDGHSPAALRTALAKARNAAGKPTVVLAQTLKGKGVPFFEGKDGWHGKPLPQEELDAALQGLGNIDVTLTPPPCERVQGPNLSKSGTVDPLRYEMGQQIATREAYGNALVRLAKVYPNLVALDADTKNSTFSQNLLKSNPDRFVECFIAEQNMVGVGLGFASMGWIPCMSTFACFLTRAYDFIRMAVISQLPHAIFCGSHCGVSIGEDGPSQMGLEDLGMMRSLVESTVVYPSDGVSAERLMEQLVEQGGISYMRTSRPKTPVLYSNDEPFPIGGSKIVRQSDSDKCTVVAAGVTLHEALKAHEQLKREGINVRVIDAYSIKPIDKATLEKAAAQTGQIVTVEDHALCGGLGDAVCQALAGKAPIKCMGVTKVSRSGKPEELMAAHGIDAAAIVQTVKQLG